MLTRRSLLFVLLSTPLAAAVSLAEPRDGVLLRSDQGELLLASGDIVAARAMPDDFGTWAVEMVLGEAATRELESLTAATLESPLAILFQEREIAAPVVREVIKDGRIMISGLDRVTAARIAAFATYGR